MFNPFNTGAEDDVAYKETVALATSIERTIESHWGYVLTNYDDAMRALERLGHGRIPANRDYEDANESLRTILRRIDDRLTDATYMFKEIWEVIYP